MELHAAITRRSTPHFNPTCTDAQWYACDSKSVSKFVGCCAVDPCNLNSGCTTTNLRPVAFNSSIYNTNEFPPDPDCGASSIKPFSCVSPDQLDTFWGCCKNSPCTSDPPKCSDDDLMPAFLKTEQQFRAYANETVKDATEGATQSASSSSASSSSASASAITSTSAINSASAAASVSASANGSGSGGGVSTGAIVGAAVGGAVAIAVIAAVLIFLLRRKKKEGSQDETGGGSTTEFVDSKPGHRSSMLSEAPPNYESPQQSPNAFGLSPHMGYAQNFKGYQQVAQAPMELHAESSTNVTPTQVYAELPADDQPAVVPVKGQQAAEMDSLAPSPGAAGPAELESPALSPALVQKTSE
ncbi:hypothetical protein CC80DRAFT_502006 [Byssothecium circinans]|uniref:Uncharacterized protein n=1 Tax=Byssothecium circinans TaxID=147558 RepID=A0A6A5U694_9PLEO|nr:hypothetical protein CC80DRAFT_502006 [Byssothecium circinans]